MSDPYIIRWGLPLLAGLSAGLMFAVSLVLTAAVHIPFLLALVLSVIPTLVVFVWGNSVRRHAIRRHTGNEGDVEVDEEGLWVSHKLLEHCIQVLSPGEKVYLITRFHPAKLVAQLTKAPTEADVTGLLAAAARLFGGVLVVVGLFAGLFFAVAQGYLPWWDILIALCLFAALALYLTVEWRYTVFILTDKNARLVFIPPLLLAPIMRGFTPDVALSSVQFWDKEDSAIANFFGMNYARILMDTASERDKPFNDLYFMKHPEWVLHLIEALVEPAKQKLVAGGLMEAQV
jgi:hypothetical protein